MNPWLVTSALMLMAAASTAAADDAAMAPGPHDATVAQIFEDEAGHWEGACKRAGSGSIRAVFDIAWSEALGHTFEGHYGDAFVQGRSEIIGGHRIDHLAGADAPSEMRIESAARAAPDRYRYVLTDASTRMVISRLADRQVMEVTPLDAPALPVRLCTYTRTGPPETR